MSIMHDDTNFDLYCYILCHIDVIIFVCKEKCYVCLVREDPINKPTISPSFKEINPLKIYLSKHMKDSINHSCKMYE